MHVIVTSWRAASRRAGHDSCELVITLLHGMRTNYLPRQLAVLQMDLSGAPGTRAEEALPPIRQSAPIGATSRGQRVQG